MIVNAGVDKDGRFVYTTGKLLNITYSMPWWKSCPTEH